MSPRSEGLRPRRVEQPRLHCLRHLRARLLQRRGGHGLHGLPRGHARPEQHLRALPRGELQRGQRLRVHALRERHVERGGRRRVRRLPLREVQRGGRDELQRLSSGHALQST